MFKKEIKNKFEIYKYFHENYFSKKKKILISGGSSVRNILNISIKKKNNFNSIFLLSDERIVKNKSKLRNDYFFKILIKKKIIQKKNFLYYKKGYASIEEKNKINSTVKKKFHIAILGLGSNGHIASIFDLSNIHLNGYYFINNSPKFPKERITISIKTLQNFKKIYLLAKKKNKLDEINRIKRNFLLKKIINKVTLFVY